MTILEIKNLIKNKKPNIDDKTLEYLANYFYVALKKNVIPSKISLEELINNALLFINKIEFYDENHFIYKEKGSDVKGYCDNANHILYIRANLEDPLKEMIIYHEIHHAVQTNPNNLEIGINQKSNIGRLIMEAQTEYFAEEVYKIIHQVEYSERKIPTEQLRMTPGGIVTSSLHNYELYDNLLTKLALILEVPKDYFVTINYLYQNNEGLKLLEEKYKEAERKYELPYNFKKYLLYLDYVYCVDYMAYIANPDKEVILKGEKTRKYEIHPNLYLPLSLKNEQVYLSQLDGNIFLCLVEYNGPYQEFAKYIIDSKQRFLADEYIDTLEEKTERK